MISNRLHDVLDKIYPVSRETIGRLEIYVELLTQWQKKTNLIAPSTLDEIWERHIADSLQILAIKPDSLNWLDLGSGGGFPGLVIAAVMADHEAGSITLIESNNKKTAFLRQANRAMGAGANIVTSRIEDAADLDIQPEVVTARALTALPNLLQLSSPWLCNGAVGMFHKGREYRREIAETDGLWDFDLVDHKSRVSDDSVILEITNLRRI